MGCHMSIFDEWEHSRHFQGWTSDAFQEERSVRDKPDECGSCHGPERLLPEGELTKSVLRSENLDTGVDCFVCHVDNEGIMHGPNGAVSTGHLTQKNTLFTGANAKELCNTCHNEMPGTIEDISCLYCHMPSIRRKHAEDPFQEIDVPVRKGRAHTFIGPHDLSFLQKSFDVTVSAEGLVTVRNRAGHGTPGTGQKLLVVETTVLNTDGTEGKMQSLEISRKNPIMPGKAWTHQVSLTNTQRVRVTLKYRLNKLQAPEEFSVVGSWESPK